MDPNVLHLIVAGGLTVVAVVITALAWSRAQVKTVFWWIGLSLVPMAVYFVGLGPATEAGINTLRQWWGTLSFTPLVWVGLVLGGLAALLMLGSRLIPSESYRDRRAAAKASAQKGSPAQAPGAAPRPAVGSRPSTGGATAAPKQGKPASGQDGEFDEIAELLRKRGIN